LSGPLIVTATFAPGDDGWLQQLRREHYPPEHNRVPTHLTLFRHLPPSVEAELRGRMSATTRAAPPAARIAGVMDLGEGTALSVESPALVAIRADFAEALHGLLTPQDQAGWRPHVTIQNKVPRRVARALQARLAREIAPRALAIDALALWRYATSAWEPVRRFPFRG